MESQVKKMFVIPENEAGRTFEFDESLPSLPVPSLHHTLKRYLDSVKPFVTDDEFAETAAIVSEFEQGIGAKLHVKLLKKAKRERNWLERWWEDIVYLSNRQPLLPFSHMIGIGVSNELTWGAGVFTNQIKNAALLCHFTTDIWKLFREQRIRPNQSQIDKKYLNMFSFRRFFNCVRVPGEIKDSLAMYFRTASEGTCPSHVIVLCEGRIFTMNGLDAKGGLLSPPEWEHQLSFIKEECRKRKGPGLAALTCTDRTSWAKNRLHLESLGAQNSMAFNTIDTAMFVLSLDSNPATTASAIGQRGLCGDFRNRWADKSLDCVIFENGVEGVLSEHSAFDGMVSIFSMLYVNSRMAESGWEWHGSNEVRNLPEPEEIILKTDAFIEEQLHKAFIQLESIKTCMILVRDKYVEYGKGLIQKFKLHPDSYVQIALQLAYYRMHRRPAPMYETATTREFYHGRTETMRSCTPETVEFVKAMLSDNISMSTKADLLRKAGDRHLSLMKEAKANAGCDRHLLGLYCLSMEHGGKVPRIFTDPAFVRSGGNGNFILSTSLTGYTHLGGGTAPMCKDGYGCFYNILPDSIDITISVFRESHETSAYKYFESLKRSLGDMKSLMEAVPVSKL